MSTQAMDFLAATGRVEFALMGAEVDTACAKAGVDPCLQMVSLATLYADRALASTSAGRREIVTSLVELLSDINLVELQRELDETVYHLEHYEQYVRAYGGAVPPMQTLAIQDLSLIAKNLKEKLNEL